MPPKTALIIDDDPLFAIVAEETLRAFGTISVSKAEDGNAGLKHIAEMPEPFDLIICDLQMPHLDGVSVIRALGQLGYTGALIIVSGEQSDIIRTVRMMAQMAGVHILGALNKPLVEGELSALLAAAASEPSEAEQARPMTRLMLKHAITDKGLIPVYQPKYNLKTQKVSSVEVLTRVLDKAGILSDPRLALDAAEEYKLMKELTLALVDQVIVDMQNWRTKGIELGVAINLSPSMMDDADLPDLLNHRFRLAAIDPHRITLEITENRLLDHKVDILEVISRLRMFGFQLSIDDFGTGATSIEQLRLFPFTELKIDKSFVQGAQSDGFARTTLETSTKLAAMLNIPVVAEGVETPAQLELVQLAGASLVQGYLISHPLQSDDLIDWMMQHKKLDFRAA